MQNIKPVKICESTIDTLNSPHSKNIFDIILKKYYEVKNTKDDFKALSIKKYNTIFSKIIDWEDLSDQEKLSFKKLFNEENFETTYNYIIRKIPFNGNNISIENLEQFKKELSFSKVKETVQKVIKEKKSKGINQQSKNKFNLNTLSVEELKKLASEDQKVKKQLEVTLIRVEQILNNIDSFQYEQFDTNNSVNLENILIPIKFLASFFHHKTYLMPYLDNLITKDNKESLKAVTASELKEEMSYIQQKIAYALRKNIFNNRIQFNQIGMPFHPDEILLINMIKGVSSAPEKYISKSHQEALSFFKDKYQQFIDSGVMYQEYLDQLDPKLKRAIFNHAKDKSEYVDILKPKQSRIQMLKEALENNKGIYGFAKQLASLVQGLKNSLK